MTPGISPPAFRAKLSSSSSTPRAVAAVDPEASSARAAAVSPAPNWAGCSRVPAARCFRVDSTTRSSNRSAASSNPDPAQLQSLGVSSWPTWGCEISSFPWTYDEQESCLLLEGDVTVTPDGGEPVRFGAGDLVVFEQGLSCTWDVHALVRKHYRFG